MEAEDVEDFESEDDVHRRSSPPRHDRQEGTDEEEPKPYEN